MFSSASSSDVPGFAEPKEKSFWRLSIEKRREDVRLDIVGAGDEAARRAWSNDTWYEYDDEGRSWSPAELEDSEKRKFAEVGEVNDCSSKELIEDRVVMGVVKS